RASGSIKAGVRDLAPWLRLQLVGEVYAGKRLVSAAALAETHRPQVVVRSPRDDALPRSYGLGWHVEAYPGHPVRAHGGAVDGFRARVVLVPEAKLGVAVLANLEETDLVDAAAGAALDHLLGLPKHQTKSGVTHRPRPRPRVPPRHPGTKPS